MFTNTTENADNHTWLFGDGNTNNSPDPGGTARAAIIHYAAGSNECGTDTLEQMITLSGQRRRSLLSASTPAVRLSRLSTGRTGLVTNWRWYFPGGMPDSSTEPNPTVVYQQPGMYDVNLTVWACLWRKQPGRNRADHTVVGIPSAPSPVIFGYPSCWQIPQREKFAVLQPVGISADSLAAVRGKPTACHMKRANTVVLTVSNACGNLFETKVVANHLRMADESWLEALNLFPNPNSGALPSACRGNWRRFCS